MYYCTTCGQKYDEDEVEEDEYGPVCPECGSVWVDTLELK